MFHYIHTIFEHSPFLTKDLYSCLFKSMVLKTFCQFQEKWKILIDPRITLQVLVVRQFTVSGFSSYFGKTCFLIWNSFIIRITKGIEPDERCLYHDDDMIFTQEELLAAYGDTTRNGINEARYRWPGNSQVKGQLPYDFDRNDIAWGSNEEKFIKRVIKRFNIDLEGCLKIV